MTNRRQKFFALMLATLCSLTLLGATGCAGALMMPYYLIYGTDAQPVYKDEAKAIPKGSKLVVICRSNLNLFGSSNPNSDLATAVTLHVSRNIKNKNKKTLEWIPVDRVNEQFDEEQFNTLSFEKMGAQLGADYVIGIELDSFEIHHSTQFYQGNAKVLIRLVDVKNHETIFAQSMPTYTYPPTPVPVSDLDEMQFQNRFVVRLAKHISTLVCPYDPHEEYAVDSDFPER